jgi:nitrite reductase/ring-hydroxylating ferredoxin subunit
MATHQVASPPAPAPGQNVRVEIAGRSIAVFNVGGTLFAIDAKCTHVGGPLERGAVRDGTVTCPWHGSQFELATGAVKRGPAAQPVRSYRVRSEGTALAIDIE